MKVFQRRIIYSTFFVLGLAVLIAYIKFTKDEEKEIKNMLSKEDYIIVANEVAKSQKISLEEWDIVFDDQNKFWLNTLNQIEKEDQEFAKIHKQLLKGKKYQVVYYVPRGMIMAGMLFVFIDKQTGEVIDFIGGI